MAPSLSREVLRSGIWQLSSAVLGRGRAVVVVDPGYFPRELAALAALAGARGEVQAVVFTHGHWDHVIGWSAFPGAPVHGGAGLHRAVAAGDAVTQKNLREAEEFDARWYIERPAPLRWPAEVRPLEDGDPLAAGLRALLLPGHSDDGLALLREEDGLLLCGDYLSPCEIPFVEDLRAYRKTLQRLQGLLDDAVAEVVPGHGPLLPRRAAQEIAAADLAYLDALLLRAERGDEAGALALPLPQAAAVPGMADHHRDNWQKALIAAAAG